MPIPFETLLPYGIMIVVRTIMIQLSLTSQAHQILDVRSYWYGSCSSEDVAQRGQEPTILS